jgi:GR25 family glycosyltransferase involved in LPS biosynthesis
VSQPLPVYVVHAAALVARRTALERSLARLGWTAEWIVDPEPDLFTYFTRRVNPRLSLPQASVYLKHLSAWRSLIEARHPRAFVLEDDPLFDDRFAATFDRYLSSLPADAGAAFFGASVGLEREPIPGNPLFARVDRTRSMSGYVATAAWCRTLIDDLGGRPLRLPIDLAADEVIRRRGLSTYWSVPALIGNGSESGAFARAVTKGGWRRVLRRLTG